MAAKLAVGAEMLTPGFTHRRKRVMLTEVVKALLLPFTGQPQESMDTVPSERT